MRIDQVKTLTDAREFVGRDGFVIIERPHDEVAKLAVTNNGGLKRNVYHEYTDLEHLKRFLFVYRLDDEAWERHFHLTEETAL